MARLISFMQVSVDGCYADANGDMSFAHGDDPESIAFMTENAQAGGALVFGRITYEMMASYWPTQLARKSTPEAAASMNRLPKLVFSRTLKQVPWENSRLVTGDLGEEMRRLKVEGSLDMAILGSGSLVAALSAEHLIDEYQLLINPVILGDGKRLFAGVGGRPRLALEATRQFKNGNVLLRYTAA